MEGQRAGSFRQARWAGQFLEAGSDVTVFNVKGATGLTVSHFTSEEQLVSFRSLIIAKSEPKASVREGLHVRVLRRIKHLTLVDLYLPNILHLIFTGCRRLNRTDGPLVLMASSPPFSSAVAGAVLKALFPRRIVFAVDMRDAWAMHASLGGIPIIKRFIEKSVLRRADFVSTVSGGLSAEFERVHGTPAQMIYNVATHYFDVSRADPPDWTKLNAEISKDRFKIIYTGSTPEGFYDVATIVRVARRLRSALPNLADRVQFVFVGACDEVQREVERQRCAGNDIVFVPHVSHTDSRAIQQHADALLFLGYYGVGVVSTKIFEYLALGRPILPLFVTQGSDVDQILRRYCGRTLNLLSVDEIADTVQKTLNDGAIATLPHLDDPGAVRAILDDYRHYVQRLLRA